MRNNTLSLKNPYQLTLREKCANTEFFLVRIFPQSDWIRRDTEHTNQKKLRIWTLFTQCNWTGSLQNTMHHIKDLREQVFFRKRLRPTPVNQSYFLKSVSPKILQYSIKLRKWKTIGENPFMLPSPTKIKTLHRPY